MILSGDISSLLLLARLSEISRHSRSYGGMQQYVIILAALGLLLVLSGVIYAIGQLSKRREKKPVTETVPLLQQLVNELQLTVGERHLLTRVASRNAIQPPEVMFIDPGLWGPCLESCPHDQQELTALMEKLFGSEIRNKFLPTESVSCE